MGGGMLYGEPYNYRYPYGSSETRGNSSARLPRRQSSFWGDESYPEEVTNLARKRKLDGVKREPLGSSNGKNVREIFVEDPSVSRISRPHDLQAPSSRGLSPPASSPSGSVRMGPKPSEAHVVTIPVVFSSEATNQKPVSVVPPEGMKKPRTSMVEVAAAVLIQSAYRGYAIRRTKPLEHMRKINSIRTKVKEFEQQLSDADLVQKMRTDINFRLRITEGIMVLLLQLDSIQGVHSDVRVWRKAVTKEVVTMQERVDALLKGQEMQGPESAVPSVSRSSDDDETMAGVPQNQDTQNPVDLVELEDNEAVTDSEEMAVEEDYSDISDELVVEYTTDMDDQKSDQCSTIIEPIVQLKIGEEAVPQGAVPPSCEIEQQETGSTSHGADSNEAAHCGRGANVPEGILETLTKVDQQSAESREESRRQACLLDCSVEKAGDALTTGTEGAVEIECPGAVDVLGTSVSAEGETGMVEDKEEAHLQKQGDEGVGGCSELECHLEPSPGYQEKLKDFLNEISNPRRMSQHLLRPSRAEEYLEAPCTPSDLEENDGAVARLGPGASNLRDDADGGATTVGCTKMPEHDHLLFKLSEENKMLRSLLLDVMKWNQLQANNMKSVTERLGKLEDKLMRKKASGKPKAHRSTRSGLERRWRK